MAGPKTKSSRKKKNAGGSRPSTRSRTVRGSHALPHNHELSDSQMEETAFLPESTASGGQAASTETCSDSASTPDRTLQSPQQTSDEHLDIQPDNTAAAAMEDDTPPDTLVPKDPTTTIFATGHSDISAGPHSGPSILTTEQRNILLAFLLVVLFLWLLCIVVYAKGHLDGEKAMASRILED